LAWKNGAENAYVSGDLVRMVAKRFWGSEIAGDFSTYDGKALAAKKIQDRQYAKESLILCDYAWPIAHTRYTENHLGDPAVESKIYAAVVGREIDEEGLYRMGEKIFNLQRAILVREGHRGKEADIIPEFNYRIPLRHTEHNPECLLPGEGGKPITRKEAVVDKDKFNGMRAEYYSLRGWDVGSGLQTVSKLRQLGLNDVAKDLAQRDLVVEI
jgi:aldehyde:ferredoxin oxidoreductase